MVLRFIERALERKPAKRRVFYYPCVMASCDLLATQIISCLTQNGNLAEPIAGHAWCGSKTLCAVGNEWVDHLFTENFAHIIDHVIDTECATHRFSRNDRARLLGCRSCIGTIEDAGHPCHVVTL